MKLEFNNIRSTGAQNRGVSNSVASPGVSMLFGGMPSYKETVKHSNQFIEPMHTPVPAHVPKTNQVPSYISAPQSHHSTHNTIQAHKAPVKEFTRPQTASINHSRPQEPTQQPQIQPQIPSQTQIKPDPAPQAVSHAPIEAPKPTTNHTQAPTRPRSAWPSKVQAPMTQRAAGQPRLTFENLQQQYKQKAEKQAHVPVSEDLPPTLTSARQIYREQNKDCPSSFDINMAIKSDLERSKAELKWMNVQHQKEMDRELGAQARAHQQQHRLEKEEDKWFADHNKGMDFEYYQRYPKMQQQLKANSEFLKQQKAQEAKRRQAEREEAKKMPESGLTVEQYQDLLKTSKSELLQTKKQQEEDLRKSYTQASKAAREAKQRELNEKRQEELAQIQATKKLIERENFNKAKQRQMQRQEMDTTMDVINRKKKEEWDRKVHDTTNKLESLKLNNERQRMKAELQNEMTKNREEYRHDLARHKQHLKQAQSANKLEGPGKGLDFECYERENKMKQQKQSTRDYNKKKRVDDVWRKAAEKEEQLRPPPSMEEQAMKIRRAYGF